MSEQSRTVLVPGPDHAITIEHNPSRIQVRAGGELIADTSNALTLAEAGHAPVQYIPLADVDTTRLAASEHSTYCPYKGDCSYYSVPAAADGENAVWEYREPYPAVDRIRGHVAFYSSRVELVEEPVE